MLEWFVSCGEGDVKRKIKFFFLVSLAIVLFLALMIFIAYEFGLIGGAVGEIA